MQELKAVHLFNLFWGQDDVWYVLRCLHIFSETLTISYFPFLTYETISLFNKKQTLGKSYITKFILL